MASLGGLGFSQHGWILRGHPKGKHFKRPSQNTISPLLHSSGMTGALGQLPGEHPDSSSSWGSGRVTLQKSTQMVNSGKHNSAQSSWLFAGVRPFNEASWVRGVGGSYFMLPSSAPGPLTRLLASRSYSAHPPKPCCLQHLPSLLVSGCGQMESQ